MNDNVSSANNSRRMFLKTSIYAVGLSGVAINKVAMSEGDIEKDQARLLYTVKGTCIHISPISKCRSLIIVKDNKKNLSVLLIDYTNRVFSSDVVCAQLDKNAPTIDFRTVGYVDGEDQIYGVVKMDGKFFLATIDRTGKVVNSIYEFDSNKYLVSPIYLKESKEFLVFNHTAEKNIKAAFVNLSGSHQSIDMPEYVKSVEAVYNTGSAEYGVLEYTDALPEIGQLGDTVLVNSFTKNVKLNDSSDIEQLKHEKEKFKNNVPKTNVILIGRSGLLDLPFHDRLLSSDEGNLSNKLFDKDYEMVLESIPMQEYLFQRKNTLLRCTPDAISTHPIVGTAACSPSHNEVILVESSFPEQKLKQLENMKNKSQQEMVDYMNEMEMETKVRRIMID